MKYPRFLHSRYLFLVLIIMVMMVSAYAFAAANTVPTSSAGDGSGAISGYTVTNVSYKLSATDPSVIDKVTFTLTGTSAPSDVKIKLVTASSTWFTCAATVAPAYECVIGGAVSVSAANELRVVAAQ